MLHSAYFKQLRLLPGSWGFLLAHLQRGHFAYRVAVRLLSLPSARISRIASTGGDLFIATHPFASQALGELRRTGRSRSP